MYKQTNLQQTNKQRYPCRTWQGSFRNDASWGSGQHTIKQAQHKNTMYKQTNLQQTNKDTPAGHGKTAEKGGLPQPSWGSDAPLPSWLHHSAAQSWAASHFKVFILYQFICWWLMCLLPLSMSQDNVDDYKTAIILCFCFWQRCSPVSFCRLKIARERQQQMTEKILQKKQKMPIIPPEKTEEKKQIWRHQKNPWIIQQPGKQTDCLLIAAESSDWIK